MEVQIPYFAKHRRDEAHSGPNKRHCNALQQKGVMRAKRRIHQIYSLML